MSFEAGKLLFLRNWPYVYGLAQHRQELEGEGQVRRRAAAGRSGPGASSLGGHDTAISVYSKNKATAVDFVKF
jgi:multiple sugar transport system substrate-binding protein